jgi:hypothetical protein
MTFARFASCTALAVLLATPGLAQSPWPAPAAGPGQFPGQSAPAAAPAAPGQFPSANAPQMLPQQPGTVPPPSQWGNQSGGAGASQHPAWSGGGGPAMGGGMGGGFGQPQGQPPCANELMPLRNEAQNKGMALKGVIDRKAERGEICKAFRTFVAAEAKFVKYATDNGARCGIPPDAVKVIKGNHGKSVTMSNRVCNAAAGPSAPPPPSLSDALGTSRIPDSSNVKTGGGGTFDTLSGGTLAR